MRPRLNDYILHQPTIKQMAFLSPPVNMLREVLYGGAAGGGKALSIDTPVPTPSGWATMADLRVGDEVFDEQGNICFVKVVSSVMYNRPCYEIRFSDDAAIVCDASHEWVTKSLAERGTCHRRTAGFREQRRQKRPIRGKGLRPDLADINRRREHNYLAPSQGQPRTTQEIGQTIKVRGRINHSVEVAAALVLLEQSLPIVPYVLGLWLGDGTSANGGFTTTDAELLLAIKQAGYSVNKQAGKCAYGILGLHRDLRIAGLLGNKHIPQLYLRASIEQRTALLQGLMDTDGTVTHHGHCEFTSTNPTIAEGFIELVHTLGIKARLREGRAKLNGKDCGPNWRCKFVADLAVCRIKRKVSAQKLTHFRGTHKQRYIKEVRPVDSVPVKCIKVSSASGQFLCGQDMIPTHNSDALLMGALQYVDVPGYAALLFRRTYTDLTLPGALMPRAKEWLLPTGAQWSEKTKTWTFPSGATLTFGFLEYENDKFRYQSSAYQYIGFDELTQFDESQYTYLFSRLRRLRGMKVPLRMRSATNPGGRGHDWVKQRFLIEKDSNRLFIPAKLADNRDGVDGNPHIDQEEYIQSLSNLDPTTRQQLLDGNWDALPEGYMFKRAWFKVVDEVPRDMRWVRFWDLAATEKTANNNPAATAGIKLGTDGNGFYITDVRCVFKTAGAVKKLVRQTAEEDGPAVAIRMEQEPGSSGKADIDTYRRDVLPDFDFKGIPSTGSKEVRARPVAGQAEQGYIMILRAEWNRDFLDEVTRFPMKGVKNDQVDGLSGAYGVLAVPVPDWVVLW